MPKTRKNRKDQSHLSKKRAERWYKRLIVAEVKRGEKRRRKELRIIRETPEPSFSPSNSPIPENSNVTHDESHSPRSRTPSPTTYESDCYDPYYINCSDDWRHILLIINRTKSIALP
jgi:hypothetical protein